MSTIVEKLKKMIAHEKSAREIGNLDEATAFAGKIQEMLTKYKLDMNELDFIERENEPIEWEQVDPAEFDLGKSKERWQIALSKAIGDANTCGTVYGSGKGARNIFWYVGRSSDRIVARTLFVTLVDIAYRLADRAVKENTGEQRTIFMNNRPSWLDFSIRDFKKHMKQYEKSWYLGFASAVIQRLLEKVVKAEQSASGSNALVHLRKDQIEIRKSMAEGGAKQKVSTVRTTINTMGFAAGAKAGKEVALTANRLGGGNLLTSGGK